LLIFVEASAREIEAARAGAEPDDFAVMADDLMFYRASARERLEAAGVQITRVAGRRPLWFAAADESRAYDFAELPTLDLIVVHVPGSDPVPFATLDVERAVELYRSGGRHGGER
jgi:hypothetical protein